MTLDPNAFGEPSPMGSPLESVLIKPVVLFMEKS